MAAISIEVDGNAVQLAKKTEALKTLANLDCDSLVKLAELSKNQKALGYLKNPPIAVKIALGI